jgi:hypothetical protein
MYQNRKVIKRSQIVGVNTAPYEFHVTCDAVQKTFETKLEPVKYLVVRWASRIFLFVATPELALDFIQQITAFLSLGIKLP